MICAAMTYRYGRRHESQRFKGSTIPSVVCLVLFVALSCVGCGGGGSSGGGGGAPPPPPSTTQMITLAANWIVYDSNRQRIYASVGSSDAKYPNSIAFIDPTSATITTTISIGAEPNRLALAQDGSYLYVGADGINSVQRINLNSNAIDETVTVGSDNFGNPLAAGDIEVMPGSPGTIAVARTRLGQSPPRWTSRFSMAPR